MRSYYFLKYFLSVLLLCRHTISQPTVFKKQWYKDTKCVTDENDILTTMEYILVDLQRLRFDTKELKDASAVAKTAINKIKEDINLVKTQNKKLTVGMSKVKSKVNVIKANTEQVIGTIAEVNRTVLRLTNHSCNDSTTKANKNTSSEMSNIVSPISQTAKDIIIDPIQDDDVIFDKSNYVEGVNYIEDFFLNPEDSDHKSTKTPKKVNILTDDTDDIYNIDGLQRGTLIEIEIFSGEKAISDVKEVDAKETIQNDEYENENIEVLMPVLPSETVSVSEPEMAYLDGQNTSEDLTGTLDNTISTEQKFSDLREGFNKDHKSKDLHGIASPIIDNQIPELVVEKEDSKHDIYSDCSKASNSTSGVFIISPPGTNQTFPVYCHFDDNGQWLVFQRRLNGDVDFYRDWDHYRDGFGQLDGEFWLGNDKLHVITTSEKYMLRIDMWDWNTLGEVDTLGNHFYAESNSFYIDNESEFYRLHVPTGFYDYSGFGGSGLRVHAGPFMTFDRRHPEMRSNCAQLFHTGWWFKTCVRNANLNGRYYQKGYMFPENRTRALDGVFWRNIPRSLKKVEMKLKRI